METACAAPDACSEAAKSRRAAGVGVGVEDEEWLLGDWVDRVGGDGDSAAAGERSLANLPVPVDMEPNALLAAASSCCWCSGVVGSDDTPGRRLDDGLRMLRSGVSSFGETPFRTASFLSNELPTIDDCFDLSQLKKLVKNAGSSPSVTASTVVSIGLPL